VQQIFVYGDSLSWGIIPGTRDRLPFQRRWPGVMEGALVQSGLPVRVVEDCLNGRRTVWEDPFKPGRNGREGLARQIEAQSPLTLVVVMLGTNDFQFCHTHNDAWASAQGVASLVSEIRNAPLEPGMPAPPVLIVCPPPPQAARGAMASRFRGAEARCGGLSYEYGQVAASLGCHYFDAGMVTRTSSVDGIHLDADQHFVLGNAIAGVVRRTLLERVRH
jgi:lysophospholipase L1-like esterase